MCAHLESKSAVSSYFLFSSVQASNSTSTRECRNKDKNKYWRAVIIVEHAIDSPHSQGACCMSSPCPTFTVPSICRLSILFYYGVVRMFPANIPPVNQLLSYIWISTTAGTTAAIRQQHTVADRKYIIHARTLLEYFARVKMYEKLISIFHLYAVDSRSDRREGFVHFIASFIFCFLAPISRMILDVQKIYIFGIHFHYPMLSQHIQSDQIYSSTLSLIGMIEICI